MFIEEEVEVVFSLIVIKLLTHSFRVWISLFRECGSSKVLVISSYTTDIWDWEELPKSVPKRLDWKDWPKAGAGHENETGRSCFAVFEEGRLGKVAAVPSKHVPWRFRSAQPMVPLIHGPIYGPHWSGPFQDPQDSWDTGGWSRQQDLKVNTNERLRSAIDEFRPLGFHWWLT